MIRLANMCIPKINAHWRIEEPICFSGFHDRCAVCRRPIKLSSPAGAGSYTLGKAYRPAGSGAAPGSACPRSCSAQAYSSGSTFSLACTKMIQGPTFYFQNVPVVTIF